MFGWSKERNGSGARRGRRGRSPQRIPASRRTLACEPLEPRCVPVVTPLAGFAGMAFADSDLSVPPDTHAAVGPSHVVEVINTTVAFYNKADGMNVFQQPLGTFFAIPAVACADFSVFDPKAIYDDAAGRFIVTVVSQDPCLKNSDLFVAVSDDSDPNGSWETHDISVADASLDGTPNNTWGDFPSVGFDADAIYVSLNMYTWNDRFDHVRLVAIDAATATDGDAMTFTHFESNRDGSHFTMWPATMHGASAGAAMYLVEEAGFANGSKMRVVKLTDKLTATPTFTDTDITVASYTSPPAAKQPGGGKLDTGDTGVLSVDWRGDRLVATQTVGLVKHKEAHVRWYEFSTAGATPTLTQQGTLDFGKGVSTYYASIAIAPGGDLGIGYMRSSKQEFMSIYATGQKTGAAAGTLESSILIKAGVAKYSAFGKSPFRAGDYSSIVIDPSSSTTFWLANEWATSVGVRDNWGTWIASFMIGP